MDKNTKNILILGGIAFLGYIAYKFLRKPKSTEEPKSNLVDDLLSKFGSGNVTQISIRNKTAITQKLKLFDAYSLSASSNIELQINPNLSYFNKTLLNEPKKLKKIKILVNQGGGGIQATEPMTFVCKDSNGDMASRTLIPMISSTQFQANVTEVYPDVVLNGECVANYQIQPMTTVTLILEYDRNKTSNNFSL